MKYLLVATITICFCTGAIARHAQANYASPSVFSIDKRNILANKFVEPSKILIINTFDVMSLKERKNKKEFFRDLTDSVVKWIADNFQSKGEEVVVLNATNYTGDFDSTVISLLHQNDAKLAIVVTFLNVWFDLTHVEVERNYLDKSKNKTAFFDICSNISYKLYNDEGLLKKSDSEIRRFFTSRQTMGAMLSFGPDVVGKRKHVIAIMHDNTMKLLAEL